MNKRHEKIINLLKNNQYLTGNELAKILNVSDRTIRNDIKKINEVQGKNFIFSSNKFGYKLNNSNPIISKNRSIDDINDRKAFILKNLLKNKNEISYDFLINNLLISDTNLNSCIYEINEEISKINNLTIKIKKNKVILDGSEHSVRLLYRDLLYKETKDNIFNLDQITNFYENFDIVEIKQILEDILKEYKYIINEITYPLLIIHLGITIDRVLSGNALEELEFKENDFESYQEYEISKNLFSKIEQLLNIDIPQTEIKLFSLILRSKKYSTEDLLIKETHLNQIIRNLLYKIHETFDVNLSQDEELINGLYLHVKALVSRYNNNQKINCTFLDEIRHIYVYIYEIALFASKFLEEQLNITINEEETAFIALHLGASYKKSHSNKFRVVLILPKTKAMSEKIFDRINSVFSQYITLVGIYNYFESQYVENKDVDLIITSIPLYHNLDIPTVNCSIFFGKDDEFKIFKKIRELEQKRIEENYSKYLNQLLDQDHFYMGMNFDNKDEILKFLCNKLIENNEVNNNYYKKVIERETYSSTSFTQGFAMPHSMDYEEITKSSISVLILDKPVQWDAYKVRIVFLLTIKRTDINSLNLFFSWMDNVCSDMKQFTKIIESKNYNEFIDNFAPSINNK